MLPDENVYSHCRNLFGVTKLVLLKVSVGAIVLQGLVEQFLVMADAEPYSDDGTFDAEQKTQRGYCEQSLQEQHTSQLTHRLCARSCFH